jgi:hypothetical protein
MSRIPKTHVAGLLAAMAMLGLACSPAPSGGAAALDGLLVLAADADGAANLTRWSWDPRGSGDGAGAAVATSLALPGPATASISSGRARVLAATLLDGSLHTSDPLGDDALTWRAVEALDPSGDPPPAPAWFVTWDPEGGRFATITGDLPGGADVELTLIDPSARSAFIVALDRPLLPSAPVWLDGERVALVGGSTSEPVSVIVDTTTGEAIDGPAGDRRLATSADGSVIATTGGPGSPVVIRSSTAWAAGDGTSIGMIDAPTDAAQASSMALGAGQRLAIVWQGVDGGVRVDIHDGSDGWRRVMTLDEAGRAAAVAWSR